MAKDLVEQEIFESAFLESEEDIQAEVQRILRFPGGPNCAKRVFDAAYKRIGSYGGRPYGSGASRYNELLREYDRCGQPEINDFARHWIVNVEKKEPDETHIDRVRKALERRLKERALRQ